MNDTDRLLRWKDYRVKILAGPVPAFVRKEQADAYRLYEYQHIMNLLNIFINLPVVPVYIKNNKNNNKD